MNIRASLVFSVVCLAVHGSCARADHPPSGPFIVDAYTVALYHFDEGEGDATHDATGDRALSLRAHKKALWGQRDGFGSTARFVRSADDANILIGPCNDNKLQLRTCNEEWTVEAWIKHTGPYGEDIGNTYANICGSDEEGFSLPEGMRGGWHFALRTSRVAEGIAPSARFIGSLGRPHADVNEISPFSKPEADTGVRPATIHDREWHHVAWQFRYADQLHSLFIDGKLVWQMTVPGGRAVINDSPGCDIPFHVGGFLHSQDPPFYLRTGNFEGEIDEIRISSVQRYPVGKPPPVADGAPGEAREPRIVTRSLPLAFVGLQYDYRLTAEHLDPQRQWSIRGELPPGITFDPSSGAFTGYPDTVGRTTLEVEVGDASRRSARTELVLQAAPRILTRIHPDRYTVAMWDWQGPNGKVIRELTGDKNLALTWTNMGGDRRLSRPGWGVYPFFSGGGEHGFVGPTHNDKVDLRTCKEDWTVEVWVRRGGPMNHYGKKYDYGHICGTYDNTKRGVWEFYLSDHNSPDGSMAPGVHFFGAGAEQALENLHPWKRPEGIVGEHTDAGIRDTEWHHVAWQYDRSEDLHQLFLDATLIWEMRSPDGRKLVNNRHHDAQFSICTRLKGYARYGGAFNWRGFGNFFGQIGEIRISNVRRY